MNFCGASGFDGEHDIFAVAGRAEFDIFFLGSAVKTDLPFFRTCHRNLIAGDGVHAYIVFDRGFAFAAERENIIAQTVMFERYDFNGSGEKADDFAVFFDCEFNGVFAVFVFDDFACIVEVPADNAVVEVSVEKSCGIIILEKSEFFQFKCSFGSAFG